MPKTKETQKIEKEDVKAEKITPMEKKAQPVKKDIEEVSSVISDDPVSDKNEDQESVGGKKKADKYYEAVGRRKTAIARVRLYTRGDKTFSVNNKSFEKYFIGVEFKNIIEAPLVKMNCTDRFRITSQVKGGGINAQAEALRHGITRALVMFNADFKKRLKKSGYLTRDPRMKERKKPGLKKARRAPQWAKR